MRYLFILDERTGKMVRSFGSDGPDIHQSAILSLRTTYLKYKKVDFRWDGDDLYIGDKKVGEIREDDAVCITTFPVVSFRRIVGLDMHYQPCPTCAGAVHAREYGGLNSGDRSAPFCEACGVHFVQRQQRVPGAVLKCFAVVPFDTPLLYPRGDSKVPLAAVLWGKSS